MTRFSVQVDAATAYPEAARLRAALGQGDWPAARATLDVAASAARTTLMRTAEEQRRADRVPTKALADNPADTTAAALLAFQQIAGGWRTRTTASARHVSRRRFARFHAKLHEAEQTLTAGLAHDPADPALWTARLSTARGLELGLSEASRRYANLAEIDPNHLPGQRNMLQQLCPKWGGTWEQAHAFGREAMDRAPEGAPNAVILVEGHLERDDLRYLRSSRVRDEIAEAARRSVLHPSFQRDIGWAQTMNTFAMAFTLIGDRESAAMMFTALGPRATAYPWKYEGDTIAVFRRARARAYGWTGAAIADRFLAATGATSRQGILAILGMAWR